MAIYNSYLDEEHPVRPTSRIWYLPQVLLDFITNPKYPKVVHDENCANEMLNNTFGIKLKTVVDLKKKMNKSLSHVVKHVLHHNMKKDQRQGIWKVLRESEVMTDEIIEYAGNDVYVTVLAYYGMMLTNV